MVSQEPRKAIYGKNYKEERIYWTDKLSSWTGESTLTLDYERPTRFAGETGIIELRIGEELQTRLASLTGGSDFLLYAALLTLLKIHLHKWSGNRSIVVGSPARRRPDELVQSANALAIVDEVTGDQSVRQFLTRMRANLLEAYKRQDYPFEGLVRDLELDHIQNRCPLFDVALVLTNIHGPLQEVRNDMTISFSKNEDRLSGEIEFNERLFARSTVERFANAYLQLMRRSLEDADTLISDLPVLSEEERDQLLFEWNDTRTDYADYSCIHELFEGRAATAPNATAVVFEGKRLTYSELDLRANQLARYLRSVGVVPEVVVGISLERSLDMILGLLGILKAGGAYLPLDPSYPKDRLKLMLDRSGAPVLLTHQNLLEQFQGYAGVSICLDRDREAILEQSADKPETGVAPDNLAYTIFTSGSTGEPKGVLLHHRGLCNLAQAQARVFRIDSESRVLQFASLSFDASIFEIVMAFYAGAALYVSKLESLLPGPELIRLLSDNAITTVTIPPSVLAVLPDEKLPALQTIIVAGEACSAETLRRWKGGRRFFNAYGPTETTVWATVADCTDQQGHPDIGRPIDNTQAYILDEYFSPVRVGASGQLCIGGVGLARGYIGAPDLTAERFVPDPFSGVPGARIYKTGDLARHLNDGSIEFLGRIDHQVKIRGFRIELHEVETALSRHSAVRAVSVISREHEPGDKRLVAYVVFRPGQAATGSELRSFLRESLPDYMLPSAFVILSRMPLLPNGKVNRRALPEPDGTRPALEKGYVEPVTAVEKSLAEVWAQVLGLDKVGIHDGFLDLGGDSIRSIQVRALARKRGLDFSVQQLLRAQTIHELAREVNLEPEQALSGRVESFGLISERDRRALPADIEDAYPLTALQSGMIFVSEYSPESAIFHEILSVCLRAHLDVDVLRVTLRQLFSRHPILRTSFDLRNFSQPLQLVHKEVEIPLYLDDLRHVGAAEQEDFINATVEQEKQRHIDLSIAPIFRIQIHLRTEDTFQFTLSFHHAILDGWSVASLLTELTGTYFPTLRGQEPPVEDPLVSSFSDYVGLELEAAKSDESRRYWTETLEESTHTILPRWPYPRKAERKHRIKILDASIPEAVSDRLWNLAKASSVPLKSLLLAAHLKTLGFITGQTDITTGLTMHGRPEELDGERVLGLFIIPVPLRVQLREGTWLDLARACFDAEQKLFPVRRFPVLELQRSLGRSGLLQPLFETTFNFNHFHIYEGIEESPEFQILDRSRFSAETDLTLAAQFSVDLASSQTRLSLACNVGELTEEQAERIAVYYENALRSIAESPFARYETVSLLADGERRQLLSDWNDTSADYPRAVCFHEMVEEQARQTPDALAVVFEDQRLTYRELNRRANQLARHLRSLGVGPEVRVGICMEKSLEMVVSVFGVMKAGGAYVPLDPRYPADRLAFMLDDSQAAVLLTQQALIEILPEHQAIVVCVDFDGPIFGEAPEESDANLVGPVTSDNLAYVIFTSGSTGKPKGAMISHRSLVNQTVAWHSAYDLRSVASSHLQMASFSFDVFAADVARALTTGGKLVLCPWHTLLVPDKLYALMRREEVDAAEFVPVVLRALLEYLKQTGQSLDFMRLLIVSSDAFYVNEFDEAHPFCGPGTRFINSYGLTEVTIDSTFYEDAVSDLPLDGLTPIGRPFSNTQVYTLDPYLQPTPVGVPGELCVGGDGLARGYLDRPDLTAERFIPDPFGDRPGGRLYRTGDQARFLPDGNIEMLGRIDNQVKIRGFRVELGEIESAIMQHPAVHQAVVLAREDSPGSKRLVAYLVPNPNHHEVQDGLQGTDLEAERILQWQTVYDDDVLNRPFSEDDPTFVISGWDSSYGGAIPVDEMRESVDNTVERILRLQPRRVLEIGCGRGLLLFRIAPHCTEYRGTDFADSAIANLRRIVESKRKLPQVTVKRQLADDFSDISRESFDGVVVNSVIQYFPSVDYLLSVIEGAVNATRSGGFVFIGDVRSLPLLETFHTSVQMYNAPSSLECFQLRQKAQRLMFEESELVIDPAFFYALNSRFPRINGVEVQLKRGRFHNELTKFRYDVTLHIGAADEPPLAVPWIDWDEQGMTVSSLRAMLSRNEPDLFAVRRIPNSRVYQDVEAARLLAGDRCPNTAGELRVALSGRNRTLVDPEDMWSLGTELSYGVTINWSAGDAPWCFDVVFTKQDTPAFRAGACVALDWAGQNGQPHSWQDYANSPLQATLVRKIVPQLRSSLQERLPDHMIPSAFVAIERLPLTPNGKVNRSALPAPDQTSPRSDESFVEPVTRVEQGLARIWSQLFGLERISVNDNFFELGGDSIAAIQVIARANEAGLQLSPRQVFQHQTIAELATVVSLAPAGAASDLVESPAHDVAEFSSDFPVSKLDQETLASLMECNSPVDDIYPLSPLQQGMLFHVLYEPEAGVYVLQLRCTIDGDLQVPALMEAWRQAIERHPVLRSQIEWEGLNEPVQIVKREVDAPWAHLDWRGLSPAEQEERLAELLKADQRRGFDLARAPLMRFTLVQTDDRRHQFIWSHHHVMVDGWSVGIILVEVFTSYEAIRRGVEFKLETKRPYREYISWLQKQDLSRAEAAWSDALKDFDTPTPLEIGRAPLNRAESDGYGHHRIWLQPEMTSALPSLARQHGLTVNTLVQGAWALLLSHYCGSRDVVFGAVVSGRPPLLAGFESMVGPFINSLPVRAQVDDDAKLLTWLRALQERQAVMREYEYTPLVQIKAWSDMPKDAPLFESLLSYENYTLDESLIEGQSELQFSGVEYSSTTNYPIAIRVLPGSELSLVFLYDSRRFDSASVKRVAEHLESLLAAFVARPDANLGSLKASIAELSLRHRSEEEEELQRSAIERLKSIRRKTVRSHQSEGV